jgi:c(7)-type cytochrome triheme protein
MSRLGSLRVRRLIIVGGVVAVALVVAVAFLASRTKAAPDQPIAFNHKVMVQSGINCLYCHTSATASPSATIPSVQQCMGCHNAIATDNPEVQKLAGYWEQQEPIPWTRVYRLPRFTFFSHQVHVAAGLNCENCHGDVANMATMEAVVDMNMGWCLGCHEQQSNATQLKDCVVCHR